MTNDSNLEKDSDEEDNNSDNYYLQDSDNDVGVNTRNTTNMRSNQNTGGNATPFAEYFQNHHHAMAAHHADAHANALTHAPAHAHAHALAHAYAHAHAHA